MRLKDISLLNPPYKGQDIEDTVSFIPMESLRNGIITPKEISFKEAKGKYTFFENEDLLIAKVTPCFENGNIAIAKDLKGNIGFGSSEFFVLRTKKHVLNTYLFYLSQTSHFKDAACATMCGVGGLKRISPLFMRNYEVNIPTINVQKQIVTYLDKKTSEIDDQITHFEQLKDAYIRLKASVIHTAVTRGLNPKVELKDSGIEWIGMIPKDWNVKRLKDVSFMYCGLTGKAGDDFRCDHEEYTKPYIPFTNVLNNTRIDLSQFNRVIMSNEEKQNTIKENDLIFLMSSEDYKSIAKTAVVIGNPGEVYLNSFCRGLRFTSNDIYSAFINYQLSSETYRDSLRFEARGFTRINIKINCITSQFITVPSYDEQQAIAENLDKKCSAIEGKIKNIDKQIDAYKRLRKALINEVITGQRTV